MGASVGTGGKGKSYDIELNIVPFIDLMSCLTAFLLVAAVWVNIAQIASQPKGKSREQAPTTEELEKVNLSILIQKDQIWIGLSRINEFDPPIVAKDGVYDWDAIEASLKTHKASSYFNERTDLEVAAESTPESVVKYQDVISVMDIAVKAGFTDVGITDPGRLSARPSL